jgi:hypothetical protein
MMVADISTSIPSLPGITSRGSLYDPATGRFNVRRLLCEIFIRGWTSTDEFSRDCACGRTSVFKAVSGQPVRNRIARAILEGLHRRAPRPELLE